MNDARSPWRNPIVWLVAGIPAASIVAGVGLLIVAVRQPNDAIPDSVRRTAQIQVADLGADARAQAAGLRALLRIDGGMFDVVPVAGSFDRTERLTMLLRHPTREAFDRRVELVPTDYGWRARIDVDLSNAWNVELASGAARWRLLGRLPKSQRATLLQPSLTKP